MSFSVQETLFSLLQHNAISGHENAVADVMLCEFRRQAKEVWRDRLGNVVARYGSDKPDALRLMIFAHMDEVGFMVRKIEPSGFLRFERVGGPAQVTMAGSIVTLTGDKGPVMGCIGIKSYHFAKGDERTQSLSLIHSSKKQQPVAGCCIPPGAAEDQKYLISLPSIAERILFAADDAPIRNRSVVSHSLPRISSTMV